MFFILWVILLEFLKKLIRATPTMWRNPIPNLETATQDLSSLMETATRCLAKQEPWYEDIRAARNTYESIQVPIGPATRARPKRFKEEPFSHTRPLSHHVEKRARRTQADVGMFQQRIKWRLRFQDFKNSKFKARFDFFVIWFLVLSFSLNFELIPNFILFFLIKSDS